MDTKQYAKMFKALSHPNRLEIFLAIAKNKEEDFENALVKVDSEDERSIYDEIQMLSTIGAPTISHHLKELANAGLITTERRGKYLVAKVNREAWAELSHFFSEI
jgi:ArsR family transcriptional regulator, arsenate/arsenite/antimonite-responsive transcriptional repressor